MPKVLQFLNQSGNLISSNNNRLHIWDLSLKHCKKKGIINGIVSKPACINNPKMNNLPIYCGEE